MPIPVGTVLNAIPGMFPANITKYNAPGTRTDDYNYTYDQYVDSRRLGIAASGSLAGWIAGGDAAIGIHSLLTSFGMNARKSVLVPVAAFRDALGSLHLPTIDWISTCSLPLPAASPALINTANGTSIASDLHVIYDSLEALGAVTMSGGYVAASKAMHCLFPSLVPMIDGEHTGLSYYHIAPSTYAPPLGLGSWALWVGAPMTGKPNPSPRGAGRVGWDWTRFLAAMGINQHIYELWQSSHGNPGLQTFLAVDSSAGKSGIPRIIDKVLW
jgi:hypothetical protein